MQNSFGYPRQLRLLNAADFRTVFDKVDVKAPSEHCLLLARRNQLEQPRIGFILSKKNIKHAVQRNRVKRATREFVRLNKENLPALDVVFMGRKGIDKLTNEQLHQLIEKQFAKLVKRSNRP
jgi:ribonuclease P protein component